MTPDIDLDPDAVIEAASQALIAAANLTEGATDGDDTCLKDEEACFRIRLVHFAWYQLGETGVVGETKAIARVAVEAAHKPLLSALTATRAERDEARTAVLELGDAIIRANGWEPQNGVTVELSSALERLVVQRDLLRENRDQYRAELETARTQLTKRANQVNDQRSTIQHLDMDRERLRAELTEARELLHTIWYGTVNAPARERWLRLMAAPPSVPKPDETTSCEGRECGTWEQCQRPPCVPREDDEAAGAGDGEQDTPYRQPCGCLTNDDNAHRRDCPVWETREGRRGRFWTRRTVATTASGQGTAGEEGTA
jgi:hypothetical protein